MNQKRYLVTGIASGIGAATAHDLQEQGHWVIGMDIEEQRRNVDVFIKVDLTDPVQISQAVSAIDKPIDGLCNIAGLPPRSGLESKILKLNYLGIKHLTTCLIPKLRPHSAIVNLASRAGHRWPAHVEQIKKLNEFTVASDLTEFIQIEKIDSVRAYNLSKEALIVWTKAQTESLQKNEIRINSVSPGAVDTPILNDFAQAFGDRMALNISRAGRVGQASEISPLVLFLLSSDSRWIKGTDISIDGGMGAFAIADQFALQM